MIQPQSSQWWVSAGDTLVGLLTHGAANSIATGGVSNLQLAVPLLRVDLLTLFLAAGVGVICWYLLARSPNTRVFS